MFLSAGERYSKKKKKKEMWFLRKWMEAGGDIEKSYCAIHELT